MKTHHLFPVILVLMLIPGISGHAQQTAAQLYQAGLYKEEIDGDLDAAMSIYETILKQHPENRSVAAKTLFHLGVVSEKLGRQKAGDYFRRLVSTYPDQTEMVNLAKAKLAALGSPAESKRPEVVLHRIIKTDNGYNPIAGVSQDGKNAILNKNGDLWLHNLQSGEEKQLTKTASWADWNFAYGNGNAFISPDNKWICYGWMNKNFPELRLSAIDGSSMKILFDGKDGKRIFFIWWMPDNRQILAFSVLKDGTCQLCLIDMYNVTIRNLGQPFLQKNTVAAFARPSPDGRYIAYTKDNNIYLFDTATEQESVVAENPAFDSLTGWLPDGSGIVFGSNRAGTNDLYLQELENGRPTGDLKLLRRDFGANYGFCLANDGRLFRIEQIGQGNSYTVRIDKQTMKPFGKVLPVDPNYPGVELPLWSSDGKFLYYEVYKNNEDTQLLFVRSELTGQTREVILNPKLKFWYRPVLSPDGKQFIITGTSQDDKTGFGIFTVDAENGKVNQLVKITDSPSGNLVDPRPNWSPDGSAVFYKVRSPEKSNEFIILHKNLKTGEEKEVYRGFHTRDMTISPDGTLFAYYRSDVKDKSYVIGILDIKTGIEKEIGRFADPDNRITINSCSWTPDGKFVLMDKSLRQGSELWKFSAADGPAEKVLSYPDESYGFVLHPDGEKMAYTQYQLHFELWALENFLPVRDNKVQTSGMSVTKVWENADVTGIRGDLTADGKYIRHLDRGTGDVVQFEVANAKTSRIKNTGPWGPRENYVEGFAFSHDGKKIAYDRYTTEGKPQLRVRNLDGSGLRTIYSESAAQAFDWSPDGSSILALRHVPDQKDNQLVLISLSDSSLRVLRNIPVAWYMLTRACFSPNGKYIAFSLVNEGNPPHGDIYLMTADGRNEVIIAGHPAEDRLIEWTPDGKSLLFCSDRSGTWDIWTVRIINGRQQGEPEPVKKDFGRYSDVFGFAPDGSLSYRTITPLGNLYFGEIDIETGKIVVPPHPVPTRYNGAPSRIHWSPDGKNLLYISFGRAMGNGNNNLTIRSAETGEERFLPPVLRAVWDINWAPDSRNILAWGMTVKENALFQIDGGTGNITKLADGRWAPRVSRDGKIMVYMAENGTTMSIRIRNLETGEEKAGIKVGTEELRAFSDLSPDGTEVAFQDDSAVYIVSVNGGEPQKLFKGPSKYYKVHWTQDGKYLIAQAIDARSGWYLSPGEIWRIPANGGTPLRLDLSIPNMDFFALHPDNRRFAFSIYEGTREELWRMENFLPK